MKRVYSSLNTLIVDNLHNALEQEGIHGEVRNRHTRSAMGEVPMSSVYLELWVDDEQAEEAIARIEAVLRESDEEVGTWTCPRCQTIVEDTFAECWSCATSPEDRGDQAVRRERANPLGKWLLLIAVAAMAVYFLPR